MPRAGGDMLKMIKASAVIAKSQNSGFLNFSALQESADLQTVKNAAATLI